MRAIICREMRAIMTRLMRAIMTRLMRAIMTRLIRAIMTRLMRAIMTRLMRVIGTRLRTVAGMAEDDCYFRRGGHRRLLYSARPCSCVPWDTLCFPVLKSCWCCPLNVDWAKRDNARGKAVSWLRLRVKRGWRVSESDWRDMYSPFFFI